MSVKIKESLIKQRNSFWASNVIIKAFKKDWLIDFDFFNLEKKTNKKKAL